MDNLIHKEWTTSLTTKCGDGILDFNGFYGIYDLEVICKNKNIKEG